jgi:hypothetical protein
VISGLDARTNGNPSNRYIEEVTVNYVNGNGNTVQYGVFSGDQVSTVNVNITGVVQSITLILKDGYDGNASPTVLSVSMSPVTSCNAGGALIGPSGDGKVGEVLLYPNPTSGDLFVRWEVAPVKATIKIYNALGETLGSISISDVKVVRIPLASWGISGSQLLFVSIQADAHKYSMRHVMMQH